MVWWAVVEVWTVARGCSGCGGGVGVAGVWQGREGEGRGVVVGCSAPEEQIGVWWGVGLGLGPYTLASP